MPVLYNKNDIAGVSQPSAVTVCWTGSETFAQYESGLKFPTRGLVRSPPPG